MGRTLPTFNTWLEEEMEAWHGFRRALRREDQEAFDLLFALAKAHMAEAAAAARPVPFDSLMISILLEQQKAILRLRTEVDRLGGIYPSSSPPTPTPLPAHSSPPPHRLEDV